MRATLRALPKIREALNLRHTGSKTPIWPRWFMRYDYARRFRGRMSDSAGLSGLVLSFGAAGLRWAAKSGAGGVS
jgi:hypothetical protein